MMSDQPAANFLLETRLPGDTALEYKRYGNGLLGKIIDYRARIVDQCQSWVKLFWNTLVPIENPFESRTTKWRSQCRQIPEPPEALF